VKSVVVTGSSGLIGSEVCSYLAQRGFEIHGVDNNQRAVFFGERGDTRWNQRRLQSTLLQFHHHEHDIRDRSAIAELLRTIRPSAIVHAAAQPSHDLAASIPFDDFDTNATGTLNLLEAARRFCPETPFVQMSTNKVYGDRPNAIRLVELDTRWEFDDAAYTEGIPESLSMDQSTHSLMGASKVAADIMVQEYGRYFGMPTCCLRAGCLTGPNHAGVSLHGFLSYLVTCNLEAREYTVFGYKGKQVRDNLHAHDVATFIHEFIRAPRVGEVYNIGGGKANSCSIREAFDLVDRHGGTTQRWTYSENARTGDHICYYSDLRKIKAHYPNWAVTITLDEMVAEIVAAVRARAGART
jgi:CDP-paratose 2-epimerase